MALHECESSCGACPSRCHRTQEDKTDVPAAIEALFAALPGGGAILEAEEVALIDALMRVCAGTVCAREAFPRWRGAPSDGVVLVHDEAAAWLASGHDELPPTMYEKVGMGALLEGTRWDTMVPLELCSFGAGGALRLRSLPRRTFAPEDDAAADAAPGWSVAPGEEILRRGDRITPSMLELLRMCGVERVPVLRQPRVCVVPVGRDLVEAGEELRPGQAREANGIMIEGVARLCGARSITLPVQSDNAETIAAAVSAATVMADLVVVTGGIGKFGADFGDFTAQAVEQAGEVIVTGLSCGPGGTVAFLGTVRGKPVIGMPGPPHAAVLMTEVLVPRVLGRMVGAPCYTRPHVRARIDDTPRILNRKQRYFMPRVRLERVEGDAECPWHAHICMGESVDGMVRAHGLACVGPDYEPGGTVDVELFCDPALIGAPDVFA